LGNYVFLEGLLISKAEGAIRFVIFHKPGPNWREDVSAIHQHGVSEHLQYLGDLERRGQIQFGGPFVEDGMGGMVIAASGVDENIAYAIGINDPAVASGLIHFEVRRWMITLGAL
jgi:uncharacterized protein YciI